MNKFSVENQTAFITGAAQGLGEAIAEAFLGAGAAVVMTDISGAVEQTAARLDPTGERSLALKLDVRDRSAFEDTFAQAGARFGSIGIMVNNAARTAMRPIWDITQDEWDDVLAINLRGTLFGCQIAGTHMRACKTGRIINITSLAGQQASLVAGAHYAASKAGIISLTKNFAEALAPEGVTVNAIAPAAIHGPMVNSVPKEKIEALARTIPVRRLGEPEEVGAAALYLASDLAGYVTGSTLDLNGGRLMR